MREAILDLLAILWAIVVTPARECDGCELCDWG